MDEETSETETEEEEIDEYVIVEDTPVEPETTTIVRDQEVEGLDYCPFCKSKNIGKDYKADLYVCLDCEKGYQVVES